jgi:hypothetical protein
MTSKIGKSWKSCIQKGLSLYNEGIHPALWLWILFYFFFFSSFFFFLFSIFFIVA